MRRPEGVGAHQPVCGVLAVAIAADRPFLEVFGLFAEKRSGNWKGRTTPQERVRVLTLLGVNYQTHQAGLSKLLPRQMTLACWVREFARPGVTYIVTTSGHVQIVKDGEVLDQTNPFAVPVGRHWGHRKMVRMVLEILK